MHDIIEKKLQEFLQKKNKWKSIEQSINSQAKKGFMKQVTNSKKELDKK